MSNLIFILHTFPVHPTLPPPPSLPSGLKIEVPQWSGKWVVSMDEYCNGVVGAKSKNLAGLRGKLPSHIKLPASVTLPFGCFEKVREATNQGRYPPEATALMAPWNGFGPLYFDCMTHLSINPHPGSGATREL